MSMTMTVDGRTRMPWAQLWLLALLMLLGGCAGVQTFPNVARSGDTVAVAAGWKQDFTRDDLTVIITAADGLVIVYPPGDPAVRAVVNLYPDPLSSMIVSERTGQDLTPYARTYADMVNVNFTGGDRDWWQTTVFIDLPPGLALGPATVMLSNAAGLQATTAMEIVAGAGTPAVFNAELAGPLQPDQLAALERVAHYSVRFSGAILPHAIQVDLSHDPDADHGGSGRAHVVNPRGDIKGIAWTDDGENLRVLLTPVRDGAIGALTDFKFYVGGGVGDLALVSVRAFDVSGNPISGITADVVAGR